MTSMTRTAVYPGSFNPPTVAHLAIAEAVRGQRRVQRVVMTLSVVTLAKEDVSEPRLEHRLAVLREEAARRPWLDVEVTEAQLLVDIARGHDVLVMGADKWHQIQDPRWYGGDRSARDEALAALPELALVPRAGLEVPEAHRLEVPGLAEVSSTAARDGRRELMAPAARRFDELTGAWTDLDRYRAWLAGGGVRRR